MPKVILVPIDENTSHYDPPVLPLDKSDIDPSYGISQESYDSMDIVWGAYYNGGYDGMGEALILFKDGTYSLRSLGHCSCYGPWDDERSTTGTDGAELVSRLSDDYKKTVMPLLMAAGLVVGK